MEHTEDTISGVGITITYLVPSKRSYPVDAYQVCQDGGTCWTGTDSELWELVDCLRSFLKAHMEHE